METVNRIVRTAAVVALFGFALSACAFDAPGVNGVVFADSFNDNQPQRFYSSIGSTIGTDPSDKKEGFASLKVTVPDQGCDGANTTQFCYAGWAIVANSPRDLSGFNALTFWAKSSTDSAALDEVGFGQDNSGGSKYVTSATSLAITSTWTKYYLPIPLAAKLTKEKGLFYFSAGTKSTGGAGFTFWLDDVRFEKLAASVLGPAQPSLPQQTVTRKAGAEFNAPPATVTFTVGGNDVVLSAMPAYFTWASSDPTVATVSGAGVVETLGAGTTVISASLGPIDAVGAISVFVPGKGTAAPPLLVFGDDYTLGGYQAFGNALGVVSKDTSVKHNGTTSLRINVPAEGCSGSDGSHFCYTGGAIVADGPQDLSVFNAMTFWAKGSVTSAGFVVFGLGNDNTGTSRYTASIGALAVGSNWVKFTFPIPDSSRLSSERGLLFFAADKSVTATTFDMWLDDIQFETVPAAVLGTPAPTFDFGSTSLNKSVGDTFSPTKAGVTYQISSNPSPQMVMTIAPGYLTWVSSNPAVVSVAADGKCTAAGVGTATVSATLGTVPAGSVSVTVH